MKNENSALRQLIVFAFVRHELGVGAMLNDASVFHDDDLVGIADG